MYVRFSFFEIHFRSYFNVDTLCVRTCTVFTGFSLPIGMESSLLKSRAMQDGHAVDVMPS